MKIIQPGSIEVDTAVLLTYNIGYRGNLERCSDDNKQVE